MQKGKADVSKNDFLRNKSVKQQDLNYFIFLFHKNGIGLWRKTDENENPNSHESNLSVEAIIPQDEGIFSVFRR